jgi:pimeloyl-ACP methyl ester carboxylesterase
VGQSTHLQCGSAVKPFLHLDPSPDNDAEQTSIDTAAQAVAQQCAQTDANLLSHLGTDDTARDLEALRLALGDPKLTYYGFSYGTYIGERYLALFPTHVRAIVLDGVVNPTEDLQTLLAGQTKAMTAAIGRAFAECKKEQSCSLTNPQASYDKVAKGVETKPLPTGTSRPLGPAELATGAIYATYDPELWESLNQAVSEAAQGDGTDMSRLADGYYDIGDWTAYADITCVDMNHPIGAAAYKSFVDGLVAQSPDFGGSIGNEMLPCAFWPTPSQPHTDPIPAPLSPDILVVGNTGDAATPYQDAQYVSTMLTHGHLITYHGEGHTSYGRDTCIDAAIHAYIINLTVPQKDPQCGGSADLPAP